METGTTDEHEHAHEAEPTAVLEQSPQQQEQTVEQVENEDTERQQETTAAPADVTLEASDKPEEETGTPEGEPITPEPTPQKPRLQWLRNLRTKRRILRMGAAIVLVIAAGSAAALVIHARSTLTQPHSKFAAAVLPFQIIGSQPAAGQTGVVDVSKIVLKFNRAIDASKLDGDFFTSPAVTGAFSQGSNDHEAVFTPAKPFDGGTSVQIMVHGEFQSIDGARLGADYSFGFTTQTPDTSVVFSRGGFYDTLGSVKAGSTQTYTIYAGNQVKTGNTITIYKSSVDQLLNSLVYTSHGFLHNGVNTSGLTTVLTRTNVADNGTFTFTPERGIYVITATNNGKQVGYAWLAASNFGVIVRQDDQQAVFAVQDLNTGSSLSADLTLYNLSGNVQTLTQATISGVDTIKLPYAPSLDLAVAAHGDDTAIVPVATLLSLADIRVQKDLSTSSVIYGLTDRPTYAVGDTIRYAGFIRTDNDASYDVPTGSTVHLYVSDSPTGTHYADADVPVRAGGVLSATFIVGAGAIPAGQTSQDLHIYNGSADNPVDADSPVGALTVTTNKPTAYRLSVQFPKSDYLASDQIAATITASQPDGSRLANQKVAVTIYDNTYYEGDAARNTDLFGMPGNAVNDSPVTVTLNANGQATVPIDVSKFSAGSSHMATVQASFTDPNGATAAGGASAIVHEGNAVLSFAASRTVIPANGKLIGRLFAKTPNDQALINAPVYYTVSATSGQETRQIGSGNTSTNTDGYAEITQQISSYAKGTTFQLTAWTADSSNNRVTATSYYYLKDPSGSTAFSDVQLSNLDVYGAPGEIQVGQTLNLTIDAPQALHTLVTVERGRIHSYKPLDLAAGKNSYSLQITDDLAPSFSLVFSYFLNGTNNTEGVTFNVRPSSKQATLSLTSTNTWQAGQPNNVTVRVHDATGNPLNTQVILGAVSANVYDLNNAAAPDIFAYLYSPRDITTNASSSLTGIGSGGGRCGGGGFDQPALLNPLGTTASWQPALVTDDTGGASASIALPKGTWRLYAYSMGQQGDVGSTYATVTVP